LSLKECCPNKKREKERKKRTSLLLCGQREVRKEEHRTRQNQWKELPLA